MEVRDTSKRGGEGVGPVGRRVAASLRVLRDDRGLTTAQLSASLSGLRRPILATGITKTEAGGRRIDVDDLVALAVALDTSPNRLLLPGTANEAEPVELTPEVSVSELQAWRWGRGIEPLYQVPAPDEPLLPWSDREVQFVRENQPDNLPYHLDANQTMKEHPDIARMAATVLMEARRRGMRYVDLARMIEVLDRHRLFGRLDDVVTKLAELGNGESET